MGGCVQGSRATVDHRRPEPSAVTASNTLFSLFLASTAGLPLNVPSTPSGVQDYSREPQNTFGRLIALPLNTIPPYPLSVYLISTTSISFIADSTEEPEAPPIT